MMWGAEKGFLESPIRDNNINNGYGSKFKTFDIRDAEEIDRVFGANLNGDKGKLPLFDEEELERYKTIGN